MTKNDSQLTYYKQRLDSEYPLRSWTQQEHDAFILAERAKADPEGLKKFMDSIKKYGGKAQTPEQEKESDQREQVMLAKFSLHYHCYPHHFSSKKRINKKRWQRSSHYRAAYRVLKTSGLSYPATDNASNILSNLVKFVAQTQLFGNFSINQVKQRIFSLDIQGPTGHMDFFQLVEPSVKFREAYWDELTTQIRGSKADVDRLRWSYLVTKLLLNRPEVALAYSYFLDLVSDDFAHDASIYGGSEYTVREAHWLSSKLKSQSFNASIMLFLQKNLPEWAD